MKSTMNVTCDNRFTSVPRCMVPFKKDAQERKKRGREKSRCFGEANS